MKVAVDKKSVSIVKNNDYDYVYLFDNESYEDLKKLGLHCLRYDLCDYVDINLTEFEVDCLKKASIEEKDWYVIPETKNYKLGIMFMKVDGEPNEQYNQFTGNGKLQYILTEKEKCIFDLLGISVFCLEIDKKTDGYVVQKLR